MSWPNVEKELCNIAIRECNFPMNNSPDETMRAMLAGCIGVGVCKKGNEGKKEYLSAARDFIAGLDESIADASAKILEQIEQLDLDEDEFSFSNEQKLDFYLDVLSGLASLGECAKAMKLNKFVSYINANWALMYMEDPS